MIGYLKSLFEIGDLITISGSEGKFAGKIVAWGDQFLVLELSSGEIVGVKEDAISSFSKPAEVRQTGTPAPIVAQQSRLSFRQFKPGDKIPLDVLKKRDPTLADSWQRHEERSEWMEQRKKRVLDVLSEALDAGREEDDKVVSAHGAIVELLPSFQFAFIDDMQTGERYFFNRSDIIDPVLYDTTGEQLEVVYHRTKNHKGFAARCVHRPGSIRELLPLVEVLVGKGDFARAEQLTDHILAIYPQNESTLAVREILREVQRRDAKGIARVRGGFSNGYSMDELSPYKRARAHLGRKEYDEALTYYLQAMEEGERVTNCIKEITQLCISQYSQETDSHRREELRQKGLNFIEEHKDELPDEMSTLYSLENIYFALGDYDNHRVIVDEIVQDSYEREDGAQYVFYQNKSAQNYLRVGNLNAAEKAVSEGLQVDRNNPHLLKTRQSIAEARYPEQFSDENDDSYNDYDEDDSYDHFSKYY